MELSRRKFLGSSTAAVMAAGTMVQGNVFGANEKLRVCVIGINGRGRSHIDGFQNANGSEVVALCDADGRILKRGARQFEAKYGKAPKTYMDMRDAFADPDIDAVSIATPNHWHALASIWAMQAGKDVYVEKPATHNIHEGQQLIAAAEKYDKIVQHGTQRRSDMKWARDIKLIQSGEIIGDMYMGRGLCHKNGNRGSIGTHEDSEAPKGLDWRLWQGPASEKAYNKGYHPYTWHWFWHYGNGEIGNQGIHQLDVAVWGMNRGFPVEIYSAGGRYTYDDMAETPNTNNITFTYEDGTMMVFEVRNRFTNHEDGVGVGNLFYANEGYYVEGKGFFDKNMKHIKIDDDKYPIESGQSCWQNFVDSVKSRDKDSIKGNVLDAHYSSGHAHLANASFRLGTSLKFDPKTEKFIGNDEANAWLSRDYHPDFVVETIA